MNHYVNGITNVSMTGGVITFDFVSVSINDKGETSVTSIYAGGDVAPLGSSTAINAMGAGKRAAKSIIEALS